MRRQELVPLLAIVIVTAAALIYTLAAGNQPLLGLDLQGGVSVVLQPTDPASDEDLDQSITIMRRRVDALGVAEPEVARQGDTVIVQLPGVDEPQRALDLIGQTAELRFRPVLEEVGPDVELTEPEDDIAEEEVVLAGDDSVGVERHYRMGPTALTGSGISGAEALYNQQALEWLVQVDLQSGEEGIEPFNELAGACFERQPECPTGQLGIVLDGAVISAPVFQEPQFDDAVTITGNFDQEGAQDLALVLRFGALPVELETQQTQTVSATIGRDALDAGVVAGLVGVVLVAIYMIAYYRLLGIVAMLSLGVSFTLLWSIISWLGEAQGLALTLAGVTGLIVAVGVSVDSNVVYFENVKEDVREGRPVRSSVERSFKTAFSTIVKADVTTLIGAGLLYWLTIGPVRGFALYLGLATILDLIVSYYLMRPLVIGLGRAHRLRGRPGWLGIPATEPVAGAAPSVREPATAGGGR
ncbi:MAG: protein translocase subunit SecD [Acidimicrobiales bacterium]